MTIIPHLASSLDRRDEKPNKELGNRLVESRDIQGIQEAAENLRNENRAIQIDCLAVLEQVGTLDPELIENYLDEFFHLAFGKENRLIWAAMINIALIADRRPAEIMERVDEIMTLTEKGSVITRDNGIKILARIGAAKPEYNDRVFPYLISQLENCRPKSVPQYAESILVAVHPMNQDQYLAALKNRSEELTASQLKRINKIIKSFS
jgi:hypothetical protein